MNKGYVQVAVVLAIVATFVLLLPKKIRVEEIPPEQLLLSITDQTRFIDIDKVAKMIIDKDPTLLLIDVRTEEEYKEYSLPGAINIPLISVFDKNKDGSYKWESIVNQSIKTNVFYSNGTIYANQAWTLCRRKGFVNNYILDGGLNNWFEQIIKIQPLKKSATVEEQDMHKFRLGVRKYMTGGNDIAPVPTSVSPVIIKKKNKQGAQGGC